MPNVTLFRDLKQEDWESIEVYADRLAAGLNGLDASGWGFRSIAPRGWVSARCRIPSLYFNRVAVYGLRAWRAQSDVCHVLDNSYGHLLYVLDARRTVVTTHGGTPLSWRVWNKSGPAMRFFDWCFAGALRAARIIAVSEYSRQELLAGYEYDPARIRVIYHGVDERFVPQSAEAVRATRARFMRDDEVGLILHVGHCAPRKNVIGLLEAFAELLRSTDKPYRLLQVGGVWSADQKAVIEKHGMSDRVSQIPRLPNADLPLIYSAADVFAFPSLYEGFGMPLIEAMACGTPVVCTDLDLFHEVCADAACYVDTTKSKEFAAALGAVLSREVQSLNFSARGLVRAGRFGWRQCASETLSTYLEVLRELV